MALIPRQKSYDSECVEWNRVGINESNVIRRLVLKLVDCLTQEMNDVISYSVFLINLF